MQHVSQNSVYHERVCRIQESTPPYCCPLPSSPPQGLLPQGLLPQVLSHEARRAPMRSVTARLLRAWSYVDQSARRMARGTARNCSSPTPTKHCCGSTTKPRTDPNACTTHGEQKPGRVGKGPVPVHQWGYDRPCSPMQAIIERKHPVIQGKSSSYIVMACIAIATHIVIVTRAKHRPI